MNTPAMRIPFAFVAALLLAGAPAALAQDMARLMELPTEGRSLTIGTDHPGRIDQGDRRYDNKYVQAWALDLRSGQQVTIDHISEDFDSYLMIVGPGLGSVLTNDDGAGDLDSRIALRAPQAGRFLVIATTFGSTTTGAYVLRVTAGERLTGEAGRRQALMEIPVVDRLEIDEIRMGRLQSGMATFEGKYAQGWTLDLMAGQEVTIDHVSEDFDSYLYVVGPGIGEILSNDDGAGDLDSRISFTAPETGRFRVVASSLGSGSTGAYTLRVRRGRILNQWEVEQQQRRAFMEELPTEGRVLRVGEERPGRLDAGDRIFEDRYMQAWALDLQTGEAVTIDHISDAFDSYLYLVGPGLDEVLSDDDGAGDLDSRIAFTAAASGRYKVIASALGSRSTGAYTLRVRAGEMRDQWDVDREELRAFMESLSTGGRELTVGGEGHGALDTGDSQSPDGKYVEAWALELRAGQEVTVDLVAEDFDCYLYLVGPGIDEMLTDDDGAGSLDSRISFTANVSGRFKVVASSFGAERTGAYTVLVREGLFDADYGSDEPDMEAVLAALRVLPFRGSLAVGQVVEGLLNTGDQVGDFGRYAQAWALELRAGEEVTIDLLSDEFDAYLMLLGPDFDEPVENDDGAGDLDSRIAYTAQETATYRVLVSSLSGESTGAFTLEVRAGLEPDVYMDDFGYFDDYEGDDPAFLQELPTEGRRLAVDAEAGWGEITTLDVPDPADRFVQAWALDLDEGQQVTVSLGSDDFDAYLRVVGPGLDVLSDDDGGVGLNSRLTFTAPMRGRFLVVAGPLGSEATGAYSLQVSSGTGDDEHRSSIERLPTVGTIVVGTERTSQLSSRDPTDVERGYVQVWALQLSAGQRVRVDLISEDFDCYLLITGPGLNEMLTNDDGAGELDSRITFTAAESGTYRVAATSFGEGATGVYTLRVMVP